MSEEKPKGRGGWRGGVKPRKDRTKRTFGLDADCMQILKTKANQADFVNEAIRFYEKYLIDSKVDETK